MSKGKSEVKDERSKMKAYWLVIFFVWTVMKSGSKELKSESRSAGRVKGKGSLA